MLSRDPTFLGKIAAVSGVAINVQLAQSVASGLSMINGRTYKIGQVGSFVRIPQGYQDIFGVVSQVGANAVPEHINPADDTGRWMKIELAGEVISGVFERGVSQYPNIGDAVHLAVEGDLRKIYNIRGQGHVVIVYKFGNYPTHGVSRRVIRQLVSGFLFLRLERRAAGSFFRGLRAAPGPAYGP